MKKILASVLALMLLLCSVSAFAEEGTLTTVGNLQLMVPAGVQINSVNENTNGQVTGTFIDSTNFMLYVVSSAPFDSATLEPSLIYTTVESAMYQSLDPNYRLLEEHVVTIGETEARVSLANATISGRNTDSMFFAVHNDGYLYMIAVMNLTGTATIENLENIQSWIVTPELFQNPIVFSDAQ